MTFAQTDAFGIKLNDMSICNFKDIFSRSHQLFQLNRTFVYLDIRRKTVILIAVIFSKKYRFLSAGIRHSTLFFALYLSKMKKQMSP